MLSKKWIIIIAILATLFTLAAIVVYYIWRLRREVVICDCVHEPSQAEVLYRNLYHNAAKMTESIAKSY
jgi:flagellar basal body-associated protein FliL